MVIVVFLPYVVEVVTESGNLYPGGVVAIRAIDVSIPTDVRTCCRFGIMTRSIVTFRGYCFCFCCIASGTSISFQSHRRAGGIYGKFDFPHMCGFRIGINGVATRTLLPMVIGIFLPRAGKVMIESGDFYISSITARTGVIGIPAIFSACRYFGFIMGQRVTGCTQRFRLCGKAVCTGVGFTPVRRTGGFCNYIAGIPVMLGFTGCDVTT